MKINIKILKKIILEELKILYEDDSDLGFMPGPYGTQAQAQAGEKKPELTGTEKQELESQLQSLLQQKQHASNTGDAVTATNLGAQIERLRQQIDSSMVETYNKIIMTKKQFDSLVKNTILNEYAVPIGYSLDRWLKYREKHDITNANYHEKNPKKKWKVVHASTKKGKYKKGDSMSGFKKVSYKKALNRIRAEKAH